MSRSTGGAPNAPVPRSRSTARDGAGSTAPVTGPGGRLALICWAVLAVGAAVLAAALGGALAGTGVPVKVGATIARSGMDAAAVACVGLGVLGVLLPLGAAALPGSALRDLVRAQARADRALVAAAGCWLVLVLLGVAFRTADALGRSLPDLTATDVGAWGTQLSAGRGMLLTACCAAAVLGCAVARLRRTDAVAVRIPTVIALLGAVLPALTGHAGSEPDHQVAVISAAFHVAAAALWVGGLAAILVLVARHRALLDNLLPRYSTLAGVCIAAVTATGILNATTRVDSWSALVTTGYGLLVLAKTALLLTLAGLGGLARRRLRTGRDPVLRWAGIEVAVMALTIGVAAALSQTGGADGGHGATGHTDHDVAAPITTVDLWVVQTGPLGPVVVDTAYRIVYRSDRDSTQPPTSTCLDPVCTGTWAPVLTGGQRVVGHGVAADLIASVPRPDGSEQVTLAGWPLYVRVGEAGGLATGGANGFDGTWFAVGPTGEKAVPSGGG